VSVLPPGGGVVPDEPPPPPQAVRLRQAAARMLAKWKSRRDRRRGMWISETVG
jgi:hypothetical protein